MLSRQPGPGSVSLPRGHAARGRANTKPSAQPWDYLRSKHMRKKPSYTIMFITDIWWFCHLFLRYGSWGLPLFDSLLAHSTTCHELVPYVNPSAPIPPHWFNADTERRANSAHGLLKALHSHQIKPGSQTTELRLRWRIYSCNWHAFNTQFIIIVERICTSRETMVCLWVPASTNLKEKSPNGVPSPSN